MKKKPDGYLLFSVNKYIGADYTSQTLIDFDWYNPHPYQRTTGIIKII